MLSLRNIEKPEWISLRQHNHILWFLSRLLINNEWVKHYGNLFCYEDKPTFRTLEPKITKDYYNEKETEVTFKTKSMAEYLMWPTVTIRLLWTWKFITWELSKHKLEVWFISKYYLYPFFEDRTTISDNLLYMWNDLCSKIWIQLIWDKDINMYMISKPMDMFSWFNKFAFEFYLDYDREKLLEKEIELWYTNKIIWDPNRWYWYTHLLRANVWNSMIMPSSAIRLILNWSKYNTYLTSRKQGKTSFSADRIVAELLSEKKWYWMRKSRRIKFFTDNASKIWKEVFEYILDFLWELKNKEIKKWVKYFDIDNTNQEIRCNLTWHLFNIISLAWLKWDTDNSTWDWLACDVAIIDEWFRITERFWRSFKDRAWEECEWILFLSTLNEETEITHWGYREMVKWECFFDWYNTIRSSEFDNTITYYNNFKNKWKSLDVFYKYVWEKFYEKMKETSESYVMKRMLCSIHSDTLLFNVAWRIVWEDKNAKQTDLRVVWVDPWWLDDKLWITIFNAMTCVVENSYSMACKYDDILPELEKIKWEYRNTIFVWDLWWPVGNTLFLLDKQKIIDYWIKSSWNTKTVTNKDWYTIINKWTMVLNWAYMLHNICYIHIRCTDLITQFGNMEAKVSTRSNTMLYEWKKWRKDDAVFSFINVCALLRITFWLLNKEDIINYAKSFENTDVYTYDDDTYYYTWWNYIY